MLFRCPRRGGSPAALEGVDMQLPVWVRKPGNNLALGTFRKKTCSEHVKPVTRGKRPVQYDCLISEGLSGATVQLHLPC